jgi:site-specific DNA-methyltransferase (adenine-specific)
MKQGRFYNEDTFAAMADIPDGVIDMLLVDLPYGATACKWDEVIPFASLWKEYNRVCKQTAAMVFTATQPFSSMAVMSNIRNFKYEWLWNKVAVTGFANAKKQPLRHVETVLVFYHKPPTYNPQGLVLANVKQKNSNTAGGASLRGDQLTTGKGSLRTAGLERIQQFTNYPKQLLTISRDAKKVHPTQKPVKLFEYLIRTYTNKGDLVLDNTAGSGTTAIAAINSARKWCCIEQDKEYYAKAIERIRAHEVPKEKPND